jgi:hypothetical protein
MLLVGLREKQEVKSKNRDFDGYVNFDVHDTFMYYCLLHYLQLDMRTLSGAHFSFGRVCTYAWRIPTDIKI